MSATVISIVNLKGGSGKTTLAMNLAAGLCKQGRTLVIDADPQGSATQWASLGVNGSVYPASVIAVGNLVRDVGNFQQDYRYIVIDCPPSLEGQVAHTSMALSDKVLIPVLPSPMDLWASVRMAKAVQNARFENPQLKAWLVLNQVEARNSLSRSMQEALAEFEIQALKNGVQRRAIYRSVALEGSSVFGVGRGKQAAAEIDAIINEVLPP
jgi:chromosome partitioning protein